MDTRTAKRISPRSRALHLPRCYGCPPPTPTTAGANGCNYKPGGDLGLWQGEFKGIERLWLRWMSEAGDLIPIPEEEAAEANKKAERLAECLRELGIDPDRV
nr:hypothetical protein [Lusitaniella coriacea]